jgi:FixJ family two-component response regulator
MTAAHHAVPRGTVHIVEDDESQRRALARFVEASGYHVKTYESAEGFLAAPAGETPACVILDLRLPGPSGLDLQQMLAERPEPLPVVFLSGYGAVPDSVRAMKSGAVDFLTKPVDGDVLLSAIGHALARDTENRSTRSRRSVLLERYERLTSREREVFAHLISGQLNKQVGYDLGITERTVKLHRHQVLEKMEADSIAELVRIAADLDIQSVGRVR